MKRTHDLKDKWSCERTTLSITGSGRQNFGNIAPCWIGIMHLSLWWVLITSALEEATLDADSMRSGLSVPWASNTSLGSRWRSAITWLATSTKMSPMIFRLSSGSVVMFKGLLLRLKTRGVSEEVSDAASPFCRAGSGDGVLSCVGGDGMGELFVRAAEKWVKHKTLAD